MALKKHTALDVFDGAEQQIGMKRNTHNLKNKTILSVIFFFNDTEGGACIHTLHTAMLFNQWPMVPPFKIYRPTSMKK